LLCSTTAPYQTNCVDGEEVYGDLPVGVECVIAVHHSIQVTEASVKQAFTTPLSTFTPVAGQNFSLNTPNWIRRGLMFKLIPCVSRTVNSDPTPNTKQRRSGKDAEVTSVTYTQGFATSVRDLTGDFTDVNAINNILKRSACWHLIILCCGELKGGGREFYFHPAGSWSASSVIDTNSDTVGECKEIGFGITRTVPCMMPRYCADGGALQLIDGFWEQYNIIPLREGIDNDDDGVKRNDETVDEKAEA